MPLGNEKIAFNFRKSLKIALGIRLKISKKGVTSASLGGKNTRLNLGKKKVSTTISVPKTGMSYATSHSYRKNATQHNQDVNKIKNVKKSKFENWLILGLVSFIGVLICTWLFG